MDAADNSTLQIQHQTKNEFSVDHENNFLVLPDGKTIVGCDGSDKKKLVVEDITLQNPREIATHSGFIKTLLFDSATQSLLVGDQSGHVKQYEKQKGSFTLLKDYGDVGVGSVLSSAQVGRFAVFGGTNGSLVVIDILWQRLCAGLLKSPFKLTTSLQVCHVEDSKVYLSVGGESPSYSLQTSECLDVTGLHYGEKRQSANLPEEADQAPTMISQKEKLTQSLYLQTKASESSLQIHMNETTGSSNF